MRKHLLTGVSAAAIILGAQSVPAKAQDDWYISLFGGGAFNEAAHANYFNDIYEIRLKNGFSLGGAVGTHVAPGLRAEFEASYLRHKNKETRYIVTQPWFPLSGRTSATFLLGNLWKDFNAGPVTVYAGGGLGLALLDIEGSYFGGTRGWDDKSLAFAGQLGAGFRVPLSGNWLLDAGYRFKMAVDASLKAAPFATLSNNATLTLYDHILQLGLTYEMGGAPQVAPAADYNPGAQNWYVSLFGGAAIGPKTAGMDAGHVYGLRHKDGFSAGVALGTHLAPGLRGELELSHMRRNAKGFTFSGITFPSSGHLNETYLLANLWKDFHLGVISPYIGLGVGVGRVKADDYALGPFGAWDTKGIGMAGQVGLGLKAALGHNWRLDAGYRFKSIVNALMPGVAPPGFVANSSLATRNHVLQLGVTYDMNGAQVEPVADMDPQTTRWYATLFGGAAWAADTHVAWQGNNFLTDYKQGFSVGAAIGTNILETVRGELEVSYLKVKGDTANEGGPTWLLLGNVKTTYVLANVWKDLALAYGISPYLGGGLGMAFVDIDINLCSPGICPAQGKNVALAGQAGLGVRLNVAGNVTLDVGYRFKAALDVRTDHKTGVMSPSMASYYHHVVQAGASVNF